MATAAPQVPAPGTISVDHISHFVPHLDSASAALEKLGFTLTPFSEQAHRLEPGGPLVAAGTANRCVMLRRGYLEILTPTGDTPNATQLRTAIKRHVGVHALVFGTSTAESDHLRLTKAGFAPLSPVALQREIETPTGWDTARFTVVRVPTGIMPEGRVQYCQHHTPHLLWQERWMAHANHATALTGVLLAVNDPQEAAQRYARFTGLFAQVAGDVWRIDTARGWLLFVEPRRLERSFAYVPPATPSIAGYALASDSLALTRKYLAAGGFAIQELAGERCAIELPPALGGLMIFESARSAPLALA
jgi:hypothetical protein